MLAVNPLSQTLPSGSASFTNAPVPVPCAPSRRFLPLWLGTVALLAFVLFPAVTCTLLTWQDDRGLTWLGRIIERKQLIVERAGATHAPKLVTFGGSSGLFGIDTELIGRELGIPTANFSTFGGFSLNYQFSRLRRALHPGDTALLTPELEVFLETSPLGSDIQRKFVWTYDKRFIADLPFAEAVSFVFGNPMSDYLHSVGRWRARFSGKIESMGNDATYKDLVLSPTGDLRGNILPRPFAPVAVKPGGKPSRYAAETLREMARWAKQRNIRLLFTFPAIAQPEAKNLPDVAFLQGQIAKLLNDLQIPVLDTAAQSFYPPELFLDTVYHLNAIARRLRTERLIRDLRPHYPQAIAPAPDAIFLTTAHPCEFPDSSVFSKPGAVRYKVLTAEKTDRLDYVQPSALRPQTTRLFFTDDAVEPLLATAGLHSHAIATEAPTLSDLLKRYDRHLLLFALVGTHRCPFPTEALPASLRQSLAPDSFCVGIIGTGPFASVHRVDHGEKAVAFLKPHDQVLWPGKAPNLRIGLKSAPLADYRPHEAPILIEGQKMAAITPGLAFAIVDPALGIVVAQGTFTSEHLHRWTLRQVIPDPPR